MALDWNQLGQTIGQTAVGLFGNNNNPKSTQFLPQQQTPQIGGGVNLSFGNRDLIPGIPNIALIAGVVLVMMKK